MHIPYHKLPVEVQLELEHLKENNRYLIKSMIFLNVIIVFLLFVLLLKA
ncbi:hypothetical protein [Moraxella sp.]|nr:hypothetical protein [Moraxella sp.]MDO4894995.1 hypothetical protein [Moraxella sp.]